MLLGNSREDLSLTRCIRGPAVHRRYDVVYFSLILIACAVGYFASSSEPEPSTTIDVSDVGGIELPPLEFDEGPFLAFAMPVFKAREMPRLHLSDRMEAALREVRSGLLASAVPAKTNNHNEQLASLE